MGRALIVSAGASSNEYISARLTELGYARPIIVPSAAEARRRMLESDFELIVVNSPLPDSPMRPLKVFSSSAKDTPRTAALGLFDLLLYVTLRSFISSIIFR